MTRLLDRLLTEEIDLQMRDGLPPRRMTPEERKGVPVVHVVADDVARMYWQSEQIAWDSTSDFGPLRPPFDYMWIEGRVPADVFAGGGWQHIAESERMTNGSIVTVQPAAGQHEWEHFTGYTPTDGLIVSMAHFSALPDGPVMAMPCGSRLHISEDGDYIGRVIITPESERWDLIATRISKAAMDAMIASEGMAAHVAMLAISLMNCKNVQLEDHEPSAKVSKRHKDRTGVPLVRYTTIALPKPSGPSKAEMTSAVGEPQPWHLVRGHFKTYTQDAPLFGSRVGTWWWGWQTRGSAKNGLVVKDYEVG